MHAQELASEYKNNFSMPPVHGLVIFQKKINTFQIIEDSLMSVSQFQYCRCLYFV